MRLVSPPKKESNSPPVATFKIKKNEEMTPAPKMSSKEPGIIKELPLKVDKLSIIDSGTALDNVINKNEEANDPDEAIGGSTGAANNEESNGVGDKIKKFEKAAEDASALPGRQSRPGSVRGRGRTERLGSDPKEDLPPPATPFKDNVHFELGTLVRQQSVSKNSPPNLPKWPRENQPAEVKKPEPQKIIKPEFKPMPSPVDVTIRSPSLGSKLPDQFPSHGTAFRNVASPAADAARAPHKFAEDLASNNFKGCKAKPKEKYSVSKGSSYFTRGSEEIWLVKKKDIEEIEERVLDSFRRAGGNVCVRSESLRPSSDGGHAHAGHSHAGHAGHAPAFTHATMGRKRQMYARSESLDPPWAGARAQTLKRQTSVACTCGHDKKTRAASTEAAPRPRSRSHGDDNNHHHVLDKYETLV